MWSWRKVEVREGVWLGGNWIEAAPWTSGKIYEHVPYGDKHKLAGR